MSPQLPFPQNKRELIQQIETERAQLEAAIADLTPEQLCAPNTCGEWSIKDVLAHLTSWMARAVTLLFDAQQGKRESGKPLNAAKIDELNRADYAIQKDRPLERVLADFRGVHVQLQKRLSVVTRDELLFDRAQFNAHGETLAQFIWECSAEHDAEHRAVIEAWRNSPPSQGGARGGSNN